MGWFTWRNIVTNPYWLLCKILVLLSCCGEKKGTKGSPLEGWGSGMAPGSSALQRAAVCVFSIAAT